MSERSIGQWKHLFVGIILKNEGDLVAKANDN